MSCAGSRKCMWGIDDEYAGLSGLDRRLLSRPGPALSQLEGTMMSLKQFEYDFLVDFLRQQHIDLLSYGDAALDDLHLIWCG